MIRVAAIVEGYGDVQAMPILLGRTGELIGQLVIANDPIRSGEWPAIKAKGSLHKFLELAHSRQTDLILLVLDLDDGCVVAEAALAKVAIDEWKNGRNISVEVVFLSREYETMFLWCYETIKSQVDYVLERVADDIRDAKGALRSVLGRRYKETKDQVTLTRQIDLRHLFKQSRPYQRLCHALNGGTNAEVQDLINTA